MFHKDKKGYSELKKYEERYDKIMEPYFSSGVVREIYRGDDYAVCRILDYCYMIMSFTVYKLENTNDFLVIYCNSNTAKEAIFNHKQFKKLCMRIISITKRGTLPENIKIWNDNMYKYFVENKIPKGITIEELQQGPVMNSDPNFEADVEEYIKSKGKMRS